MYNLNKYTDKKLLTTQVENLHAVSHFNTNYAQDFKLQWRNRLRDGPLENLWGVGGRAKYKKKFAQGKI